MPKIHSERDAVGRACEQHDSSDDSAYLEREECVRLEGFEILPRTQVNQFGATYLEGHDLWAQLTDGRGYVVAATDDGPGGSYIYFECVKSDENMKPSGGKAKPKEPPPAATTATPEPKKGDDSPSKPRAKSPPPKPRAKSPPPKTKDEQEKGAKRVLELFYRFDLNGDGKIDHFELCTVLRAIDSQKWSEASAAALLSTMDVDKDRRVSYEEFVDWVFGFRWRREKRELLSTVGVKAEELSDPRLAC